MNGSELEEMLQRAASNGREISREDFYNIMTKKSFWFCIPFKYLNPSLFIEYFNIKYKFYQFICLSLIFLCHFFTLRYSSRKTITSYRWVFLS